MSEQVDLKLSPKFGNISNYFFPSPLLPFPLSLRSRPPLQLEGLGERISSPAGPGGPQPPNTFWCILGINCTLRYLCMLTTSHYRHLLCMPTVALCCCNTGHAAIDWYPVSFRQNIQPSNGRWSRTTRVGWYWKKLTHSHPSWSSYILYQLPPFTTIHSILCVQFTCLTILFDNLSPGPLWSSSWSWTLNFILHTFLHPIIIFFSQHMPIPTQPVLL